MSKIKMITICVAVFIVISFMAGQTKADLSDGLVAHYQFNGNANDESGNGNNGTVFGAALTTDRFGNPNSAYSFDGTDDGILIPESGSLNNGNFQSGYTIAAWIKPTGLPTESGYKMIVSTNGFGLRLLTYESDPDVKLEAHHCHSQGTSSWPPFAPMPRDSWYFTVTTWDGSTGEWKMFLDSTPSYSITKIDLEEFSPSHPDQVAIGQDSWYDRWYFEGTIDDVRIYNRALSDSEVTELYQMPAPKDRSFLIGTWVNIDQLSGGIAAFAIFEDQADDLFIYTLGQCTPSPCVWGVVPCIDYSDDIGSNLSTGFMAFYDLGYVETWIAATRLDYPEFPLLQVTDFNFFFDSRYDYWNSDVFVRIN